MKIMYIGYEGFDTQNGTNHLIKTLIVHLLKNHQVVYINTHSSGNFEDIPLELSKSKNFSSHIIKRNVSKKSNFLNRFIIAKTYNRKLMNLLKSNNFLVDLVIVQSTPTAYQIVETVTKYLDSIIIFNSYDIFPDGINQLSKKRYYFVKKYLLYKQKKMYKQIDYFICNSDDVRNTYISKGISNKKLSIVYNWFDNKKIVNIKNPNGYKSEIVQEKDEKFIIQYAGNFGYTFNYKLIIDIAIKLNEYKNFTFQMIGEGAKKEEFVSVYKKKSINNIKFFPWQKEEQILEIYKSCDIQIIPLAKNVIHYSYPSKVSLIMALERIPLIIVDKNSTFYRFFKDKQLNICFDYDEIPELIKEILKLRDNVGYANSVKQKCREIAYSYFSSSVNLKKIDLILIDLGDKNEYIDNKNKYE